MLHLQPDPSFDPNCKPEQGQRPYAEAVARLATVRHALRLVDDHGGGPAPDFDSDAQVATAWDEAGAARRSLFDRKSAITVNATAAGIEALMGEHKAGRQPHHEASRTLVEEIRRELAAVSQIVLR